MIVTRTPLRISLGGGGTDLPFYASKYEGWLLTAAINKYMYITVSPRVASAYKLNYSETEIVDGLNNIKHPLIRESLRFVGHKNPVEIHSIAEIQSGTGLGSSGAFTVGLLNALYFSKGEIVSKYKLAEDASHIIMDILKEPCGKQDQYASAFGNIVNLTINTKGKVAVSPINITHQKLKALENNLLLFYTGFTRSANDILGEQKKISEDNSKGDIYSYYHEIKKIGQKSLKCLEKGDLRRFGEWMNIHWELKKRITGTMSNQMIDKWYSIALANGAIGGKLIGAGGGGFLLLYAENTNKVREALEKEGLAYVPFKFDFDGSRIVYNGENF